MKRSLLIAGGTVGGLGAVLTVTPPQFISSSTEIALPTTSTAASSALKTTTAAPPNASATKTTKKTPTATKKTTTTTVTATPTATKNPGVSGTFIGNPVSMQYGVVEVKITVANGKITDAQAIQAPTGRSDRWTQMSVPVLRQQTLAAQSAKIQGVSGASYTSYGWYTSLVSAISKAGL